MSDDEYYEVDAVVAGDAIVYERVPRHPAFQPIYETHPLEGLVLAKLSCLHCGRRFDPLDHELRRQHAEQHEHRW